MAHKLVVGTRHPKSRVHHDYSTVVSRAVLVAGFVYLASALSEVWVLWFGRGPANVEYLFNALTGTSAGFVRMLLATALIYLGLYIGDSVGVIVYRILAGWMLTLALIALLVLALLGLTYPRMATDMASEGLSFSPLSIVRSGGLSALSVASFSLLGVLGFRTRKR